MEITHQVKKRVDSKVWRFNVASIISLTAIALLANKDFLEAIGPMWYIILMIVGAAANAGLREVTNMPIEGSVGDKPLNPVDEALANENDLY